MNVCLKLLKGFLALGVRNINFLIALEHITISNFSFSNFLDLDESITVLSTLSPPSTTSLFSALNAFGADNPDDPVVFNIEVSGIAILLKP